MFLILFTVSNQCFGDTKIEGGQGALVGLQPIDKAKYSDTHKKAHKCTTLAHKGDNMERFIVGRQFLVVLLVFVINMMGSTIPEASVLGLSKAAANVFLASGLAVILTTITLGQLFAQVSASSCMLDFINNYFMLFSTYVSLGIEFSGLLHCVYLVQIFFAKVTGTPIESSEPANSIWRTIFFWFRVAVSFAVLCFAFAVTLSAIAQGKTTAWMSVPAGASLAIFFVLMGFVGLMEGMQISLFATMNLPKEDLAKHPAAAKKCELAFKDQNLQAFLIGRQILVTICMFVVAKLSTLDVTVGVGENIFGVSNGLQEFFNTGLLGAVITTIVASLAWRIIASSFPIAFLSNPMIYVIIRICLILEKCGICSSAWILSRYHKLALGYQPDKVYLESAEPVTSAPTSRREKDIDRLVGAIKYIFSLGLLVFSVVVVMAALFTGQTSAADKNIPPAGAFFIFWFLIVWLATVSACASIGISFVMISLQYVESYSLPRYTHYSIFFQVEGGQGALVGLQSVPAYEIANEHPIAYKCTELAHEGDNMERFIVGRQFLVVLLVFVINMMGSTIPEASVLGLSKAAANVFLASGLAVILTTITLGQLFAQVSASSCMLDFINNYFMLFSTYVSLGIEFSGLLHCVYLVQFLFAKATGTPIESKEPPKSVRQTVFFWARVAFSISILGFAFAVTLSALFHGKTTMWDSVHPAASVVIFFALMCLVGLMEGMQIALFAVVNSSSKELAKHRIAAANCALAFKDQNLQSFLIGRQILVTICMFVVARITTLNIPAGSGENLWGVSDGLQNFFNTGLLGAIITTIVASLSWRIIASSFPTTFLSNPLIYMLIKVCLGIEKSGVCAAAWVLARYHKPMMGYQTDDIYLECKEKKGWEPISKRDKDIDITVTVVKYVYSLGLLVFSVVMVMGALFTGQTKIASNAHPVVAFFLFWLLIIWLGMIEGGQGALVGLQPIDKAQYADSHRKAHKCTTLAHKGDNMERFIVGRQFLVVLIVFVTNMCGATSAGATVFGLPQGVTTVFLTNGLAMILVTIMLGQLTQQVVSASCMLDFINNYFMLFSTYVSLGIEYSGLLHCVYLVQIFFAWVTKTPIESKEPARSTAQKVFFWIRVLLSVAILGFSFAVTLTALFQGKTDVWPGIPAGASVAIFFVLMCFVGLMEGMQIALFAVVNLPEDELAKSKIAATNCNLTFSGNNFAAFLIGRQILVTLCMFLVAKITALTIIPGTGDNIFGVSDGLQLFFNTGLLGAIITTIVASLAWRIVASSFPLIFMSNPLIYVIVRMCLLLEKTGICSASWFLALIQKEVINFQPDATYLDKDNFETEAGTTNGVWDATHRSSMIMARSNIIDLQAFVDEHQDLIDDEPRLIHPMALGNTKTIMGKATRKLQVWAEDLQLDDEVAEVSSAGLP